MRPLRILLFMLAAVLVTAAVSLYAPVAVIPGLAGSLQSLSAGSNVSLPEPAGTQTSAGTITETVLTEPDTATLLPVYLPGERIMQRLSKADSLPVRIMVFGDSQLEGDRITSYLRSSLQDVYGGSGPGLLQPLMPVMYTRTVEVRSSSNWTRYTYLSYRSGAINHTGIGPFMSFCRFLPPDSVVKHGVNATVRVTPSIFTSGTPAVYKRLRLFYGNLHGNCLVTVYAGGAVVASDSLSRGAGPREYSVSLGSASDVRIIFAGTGSPDVYCFSLEAEKGVAVDNIPHRGSAGLEFTLADRENLGMLFSMLAPDLIILHYGLNVVKNVREDYTYYQKGLERQFSLLKELCPGAEILLAGVTDMAENRDGTISSYSNIGNIRDAQRRAAGTAGIIFWDALQAMGGENSIQKWTEAEPPLAQKDYTHFTYAGSDSIAAMLQNEFFFAGPGSDTIAHHTDTLSPAVQASDTIVVQAESILAGRPSATLITGILAYDPSSPFIFTNLAFWLFLLVLVAGYSLIYRKMAVRNLYLFAFSLFFYWKSGGIFLSLLIVSTFTDYFAARLIHSSEKIWTRRVLLVLSLMVNLGMLGYFKYYSFIVSSINEWFGTSVPATNILALTANGLFGTSFDVASIVLPVGISFFTFQTISYTVDVYRRKVEPVSNISDFGFYVSFFPQLVAGPIVRASEFVPQLYLPYSLTKREFGHAIYLIAAGLIKKMIISDYISVNFVDRVFAAPGHYAGAENLLAVYGYGLQIYCDFSGYTDIATGVALLLGFRLPVNFNSPYKATGITDFWRRWHISLSRWLKDYLYIPLGGSRKGRLVTGINLIVTMALGGLWHGASWRFVIWGLLHGVGLVINKIWGSLFPSRFRKHPLLTFIQILITFNFVSFAWIFFRAESNEMALLMIRNIFTTFKGGQFALLWQAYPVVLILIAAGYIVHFLPARTKEAVRGLFVSLPVVVIFTAVIALVFLLARMQTSGIQPFIYFRF
ncbi:MAG: hypothetical protein FJY11_00330 [Bacteroidetes bacterium]|nr:hypothetical protein [Bacteroidota bacterium]